MSESKWTPGPWEWWTSNSWRRLSSRARGHTQDGGVLCPITQRDGHPDVRCSDANKALIAAAPLLVEALIEMVYETTHLSREEEDGSHWCKISKAALTQARGALVAAGAKRP